MINNVVMGVGVALLAAVAILFKLLMSANEARGALEAEIDEVVRANISNVELIGQLEWERDQIQERFEAERARAEEFTNAVAAGQRELERQKNEFRRELQNTRATLTVEELECADSPVPDAYFDGLRVGAGGDHEDRVSRSPGSDPG